MIKMSVCQACELRGPTDSPAAPLDPDEDLTCYTGLLRWITPSKIFSFFGGRGGVILFKLLLIYGEYSCLFEDQINNFFEVVFSKLLLLFVDHTINWEQIK